MKRRVDTHEQVDRVCAAIKRRLVDGPLLIDVGPWVESASERQKLKLFAMCDDIAESLGYDRKAFRYMAQEEWGPVTRVVMRKSGAIREVAKSMADYTKAEASAMIDRFYQLAAEVPEIKLKED